MAFCSIATLVYQRVRKSDIFVEYWEDPSPIHGSHLGFLLPRTYILSPYIYIYIYIYTHDIGFFTQTEIVFAIPLRIKSRIVLNELASAVRKKIMDYILLNACPPPVGV